MKAQTLMDYGSTSRPKDSITKWTPSGADQKFSTKWEANTQATMPIGALVRQVPETSGTSTTLTMMMAEKRKSHQFG